MSSSMNTSEPLATSERDGYIVAGGRLINHYIVKAF